MESVMPGKANRPPGRFMGWLLRNRTSSRLAFVLRLAVMGLNVPATLVWTRLLLKAMGTPLNGLFLTFQGIAQLGGLGDFGLSGAVGARALQHLSRNEHDPCRRFLANARGVFLLLGLAFFGASLLLAPWLPHLFRFTNLPGAGSLPWLFVAGGAGTAFLIFNGYLQNVNYAYGTVVWPVLPGFLLAQLSFAAQWLLAIRGAPLWLQYSVSVVSGAITCVLAWWMLRISHPWLGDLRPIRFDYSEVPQLLGISFWVYLLSLGNLIYLTTDQILITAGFGAELVPAYRYNCKPCDLGLLLLCNASFVSMPGIMRRLLSGDEAQRIQSVGGILRLQKFQVFAGCALAVTYVCFNDVFMRVWLGKGFVVPVAWQVAFAVNLAITVGSIMGLEVMCRFSPGSIRAAGLAIAVASLINLVLSWAAMTAGSILGIALATVVAQSVASLAVSRQACSLLGVNWRRWLLQSWLLPIMAVGTAAAGRRFFSPDHWRDALALAGICLVISLAVARLLSLTKALVSSELKKIRDE